MTIDQPPDHADLKRAVEREDQAFEARLSAFLKVKEAYIKFGYGRETYRSMKSAEVVDAAWRAAKYEADRLRGKLRAQAKTAALSSLVETTRTCTELFTVRRHEDERCPAPLLESHPAYD